MHEEKQKIHSSICGKAQTNAKQGDTMWLVGLQKDHASCA